MGNLGGVFFTHENTSQGHTETDKSTLFAYKQVIGEIMIMNDLECMTNAFILCDLL